MRTPCFIFDNCIHEVKRMPATMLLHFVRFFITIGSSTTEAGTLRMSDMNWLRAALSWSRLLSERAGGGRNAPMMRDLLEMTMMV